MAIPRDCRRSFGQKCLGERHPGQAPPFRRSKPHLRRRAAQRALKIPAHNGPSGLSQRRSQGL